MTAQGQSKLMSMVESWVNVFVGLTVSMIGNAIILPAVIGHHLSVRENVILTAFYTALSVVRSYALRRVFNRMKQ